MPRCAIGDWGFVFSERAGATYIPRSGVVAEWFKAAVLKTAERETVP